MIREIRPIEYNPEAEEYKDIDTGKSLKDEENEVVIEAEKGESIPKEETGIKEAEEARDIKRAKVYQEWIEHEEFYKKEKEGYIPKEKIKEEIERVEAGKKEPRLIKELLPQAVGIQKVEIESLRKEWKESFPGNKFEEEDKKYGVNPEQSADAVFRDMKIILIEKEKHIEETAKQWLYGEILVHKKLSPKDLKERGKSYKRLIGDFENSIKEKTAKGEDVTALERKLEEHKLRKRIAGAIEKREL